MSAIGHNGSPVEDDRPGNWFAVSRDIFDHPIVGIHDRPFTDTEAWLWLVSRASYETRRTMNKGTVVILDPGDLMAAHGFLGTRWMWTTAKVRWFLTRLSTEAMITRHCHKQDGRHNSNQIQIITICNYSRYQIINDAEQQAKQQSEQQANSRPTAGQQQEDNTLTSQHPFPTALQAVGEGSRISRTRGPSGRVSEGERTIQRPRSRVASWLPADPLDGANGIEFKDGKLTVLNGTAASLAQDFPTLDLISVCNKAAPKVAALKNPTHLQAVTILRQQCQYDLDYQTKNPAGRTGVAGKPTAGLTPEQQKRLEAARLAREGK